MSSPQNKEMNMCACVNLQYACTTSVCIWVSMHNVQGTFIKNQVVCHSPLICFVVVLMICCKVIFYVRNRTVNWLSKKTLKTATFQYDQSVK